MGTWGHGNFENDSAADHLAELTRRLINEITEAMKDPAELEPDEHWGCAVPVNIELLNLFASREWDGGLVPEPSVVEQWKSTFMTAWEGSIDGLQPVPGFKEKRRAVLVATFDELLAHARRTHEEEA